MTPEQRAEMIKLLQGQAADEAGATKEQALEGGEDGEAEEALSSADMRRVYSATAVGAEALAEIAVRLSSIRAPRKKK